jgi:hypothetical protein
VPYCCDYGVETIPNPQGWLDLADQHAALWIGDRARARLASFCRRQPRRLAPDEFTCKPSGVSRVKSYLKSLTS